MRYVAAYLLASIGGNKNPSNTDLEKILGSVGIEVDAERVKKVITELHGKDINQIIEEGKSKLASMPVGGGAVAVSAGPAAGGGDKAAEEPAKEAKKEESEESEDDMGFGLFD